MESSFVIVFKRLIGQHFDTRREFLRIAQPGDLEDSASSHLSRVLSGDRPPPLDRIEAWADALKLTGYDRQRFLDLAEIAHLPADRQLRFVRMRDDYDKLLAENLAYRAENERLVAMLKRDGVILETPSVAPTPSPLAPTSPESDEAVEAEFEQLADEPKDSPDAARRTPHRG